MLRTSPDEPLEICSLSCPMGTRTLTPSGQNIDNFTIYVLLALRLENRANSIELVRSAPSAMLFDTETATRLI